MVEAVNEVRISTPGNMGTPSWDQVSHFFPWWAEIECSCLCLPKIIVEKKSGLTAARRAKHFPRGQSERTVVKTPDFTVKVGFLNGEELQMRHVAGSIWSCW